MACYLVKHMDFIFTLQRLLEHLTVTQLIKEFSVCKESGCSSPCSQKSLESSLWTHTLLHPNTF